MESVLSSNVDNSGRYVPPEEVVRVSGTNGNLYVVVVVSQSAAGIAA